MTIVLQRFKESDDLETKILAAVSAALNPISTDLDNFLAGAFTCYLLGDALYDADRDPMVGVVTRDVFRESFFAFHELFTKPGTFEFWLTLFRAIWGEDVEVEFTIPNPGQLVINISEVHVETFYLTARRIVNNAYIYENLITQADEKILAQVQIGFRTQQEVDAMTKEIAVNGIYTKINLVTG